MLWYGIGKQRLGDLTQIMDQPLAEIGFQVALWTFIQGRESFREAWDLMQKNKT